MKRESLALGHMNIGTSDAARAMGVLAAIQLQKRAWFHQIHAMAGREVTADLVRCGARRTLLASNSTADNVDVPLTVRVRALSTYGD